MGEGISLPSLIASVTAAAYLVNSGDDASFSGGAILMAQRISAWTLIQLGQ
jgi:hypothetical protein